MRHKKFRDETGLFLAEGPRLVNDFLSCRKFICKEIFALQQWVNENADLINTLKGTTIFDIEDYELEKISALTTAHEVLAVFEKQNANYKIELAGKITLALDAIQDPGNMGTIIRIADWFGITDIICAIGTADMYNPKVVQGTMGSLGRINIIYTDLPAWLNVNKTVKIYSASLDGKDVRAFGKLKEGIIIIGNEAGGVSEEVLEFVTDKITIPKIGTAESLNAAVATGIVLSHIV
ncbi:MAG TPA: RNA methyltransferase [Ferruginibacter sp.]|nr:RNA methyltransferase [Ferruginibacter sp.]